MPKSIDDVYKELKELKSAVRALDDKVDEVKTDLLRNVKLLRDKIEEKGNEIIQSVSED
jgi:hypothetical protein